MRSNTFRKVFSALFIFIYLFTAPGVLLTPAWAAGDIVINQDGTTTLDGGANPYSSTGYYGINVSGASLDLGSNVSSIKTDGTATGDVRGINYWKAVNADSISGGIDIKSSGSAVAIKTNDGTKGDLTLDKVGAINVSAGTGTADGMHLMSGQSGDKFNLSADSLTVSSTGSNAYAVRGSLGTRDSNINIKGAVTVTGANKAYGTFAEGSNGNTSINLGSLTVSAGSSYGYGIHNSGKVNGQVNVTNDMAVSSQTGTVYGVRLANGADFDITVGNNITASSGGYAEAAYVDGASKMDLQAKDVTVTSTGGKADGFETSGSGTTGNISVDNLSVTANGDIAAAIGAYSSSAITVDAKQPLVWYSSGTQGAILH